MLLPSVVVDVDDLFTALFHGSRTIPANVSPAFVEVALIFAELVFQVCRSPEEGVVE